MLKLPVCRPGLSSLPMRCRIWKPRRSASGSAPAAATSAPEEHGISHFLEHMAFKGTKRRTARDIAEQIEAVGGDLNAATGVETTAYYARVLKADVPLALDVLSDILSEPDVRSGRSDAREERHPAGDRRQRGHARRHHVRAFSGDRVSRSAGRPHHHGHARNREGARSQATAHISCPPLSQPRHGDFGCRRRVASADRGRSWSACSQRSPARRRRSRCRRNLSAAPRSSSRDLEQVHLALGFEGVPQGHAEHSQPAGVLQRAGRRNVVAPVPGSPGNSRAVLFGLCFPCALSRHGPVRDLCGHRRRTISPS